MCCLIGIGVFFRYFDFAFVCFIYCSNVPVVVIVAFWVCFIVIYFWYGYFCLYSLLLGFLFALFCLFGVVLFVYLLLFFVRGLGSVLLRIV